MVKKNEEYHGIIIKQSQRDARVFEKMEIISRKNAILGLIVLYKVRVRAEDLNKTIRAIQSNMTDRFMLFPQNFYAHFYRGNELIAVFRDKVFHMTPEKSTWKAALEHGKSLGIPEKQLDFRPCRIKDEKF